MGNLATHSSLQPSRPAKQRESMHHFCSAVSTCVQIVDAFADAVHGCHGNKGVQNTILGTNMEFACLSRTLHCPLDGRRQVDATVEAFVEAHTHKYGIEVAVLPCEIKMLSVLRRSSSETRSKSISKKWRRACEARRKSHDSEMALQNKGHVYVTPSSAVHGGPCAVGGERQPGNGKSIMLPSVLSTVSDNEPHRVEGEQIGDGPHKPVMLSRTVHDAIEVAKKRAVCENGMLAPRIAIVDVPKDLYGSIGCQENGQL